MSSENLSQKSQEAPTQDTAALAKTVDVLKRCILEVELARKEKQRAVRAQLQVERLKQKLNMATDNLKQQSQEDITQYTTAVHQALDLFKTYTLLVEQANKETERAERAELQVECLMEELTMATEKLSQTDKEEDLTQDTKASYLDM